MAVKPTYEELEKRVKALEQAETRRQKSEKLLRESEQRFQALHNASFGGIAIHDKGVILDCNQGLAEMTGFTLDELIGMNGLELVAPEWREFVLKKIVGGFEHPYEVEGLRKDGSTYHIRIQGKNIPYQGRSVRVTEFRDISERKQAEADLMESEQKYRRIYENILDIYFETDLEGELLEISPSVEKLSLYKREELINHSLYNVYTNAEERDRMLAHITATGKARDYEISLTDKDGATRIFSINAELVRNQDGQPIKLVGILRDVSERKRAEAEKQELEEKLARAHKMEALGLLAGGVAHDLNNVLSGIVSYPDLLLADLPEDSPLAQPIRTIMRSGQKAADIVQDLLTLARRGVMTADVLNLNTIILDYLDSPEHLKLAAEYDNVRIVTDLSADLMNIKGSSLHLRKTIMNLVLNAAEAQPTGGTIIISTKNQYLDRPIKGYGNIREGDFAVVEVADQGAGIAVEDLSRIFEPFYTKKVMGRSGTGLGMAVVWGTVQDHCGYIHVDSTEGRGTVFSLYFPISREPTADDKDSIPIEKYLGNGETILVVDDIAEQREIAATILERLNYVAITLPSGEAAVDYLASTTVDLVVLDMIMEPGIDGLETFQRILVHRPRQKAVIASGFSETDRVKAAQRLGAGEYIKKPYTLEKIGMAVKQELSKPTP